MRAFVTGGTGLLGNNLVRGLRAKGHAVRALVRSETKGRELLGDTGAETLVTIQGVRMLNARLQVSSAKAERDLGRSHRPLHETLRDEIVWYRLHRGSERAPGDRSVAA
jgi:nucleoside-diphosphate-sugar epimerase